MLCNNKDPLILRVLISASPYLTTLSEELFYVFLKQYILL